MLLHTINIANSLAASSAALWRGTGSRPAAVKPERPLELYEMENCPFCRLVREALTQLDLDALIYPCPREGKRFRPKAVELGGKSLFPFLVDPNTGKKMHESADIITYLYNTYGERDAPAYLKVRTLDTASSMVASALRVGRGMHAWSSLPAEKPLELWSFESSPHARPVREVLCELELPYLLHNIGKAQWRDFVLTRYRDRLWPKLKHRGHNRQALKERAGKVMSPYLADPNTGREMFESKAIIDYLHETYGA